MSKPLVYNYKTAEEKIAALKDLVNYLAGKIEKLEAENKKYYDENRNLTIKCRFLEVDSSTVIAYLCDGRACENCNEFEQFGKCKHTRKVEHAKNFTKQLGGFVEKDDEKPRPIFVETGYFTTEQDRQRLENRLKEKNDNIIVLPSGVKVADGSNYWIPITEREPNTAEHVLVTIKWSEDDFELRETGRQNTRYARRERVVVNSLLRSRV